MVIQIRVISLHGTGCASMQPWDFSGSVSCTLMRVVGARGALYFTILLVVAI